VVTVVIYGIIDVRRALGNRNSTVVEVGGAAMAGGGDD